MGWFDETCINSDNIDMNDCRRTINCVAPLHCTRIEGAVIDMIGGFKLSLRQLKMNNKRSPLVLTGITYAPVNLVK